MRPLALSDQQLAIIRRAAAPLHPRDRSAFLQRVAELLNGQEIGDGTVARAAAAQRRRYWDPPDLSRAG